MAFSSSVTGSTASTTQRRTVVSQRGAILPSRIATPVKRTTATGVSTSTSSTSSKFTAKSLAKNTLSSNDALHQKLCAKTVRLPATRKQPKVPQLPNELLLILLESMPTSQVCTMRTLNRQFAKLGNVVLLARLDARIEGLTLNDIDAKHALADAQAEFGPHLDHYKQFLRRVAPSDLTEALWYSNPPEVLRAICECLCRLKGVTNETGRNRRNRFTHPLDLASVEPMPWSVIKKTMARYEFKTWLLNLQVGVDFIPYNNIRVVEHIIMIAEDINYDHVRGVSLAGYRLLILVAACLQYSNIAEDLRAKRKASAAVEKILTNYRKFIDTVGSPAISADAIALAAEC